MTTVYFQLLQLWSRTDPPSHPKHNFPLTPQTFTLISFPQAGPYNKDIKWKSRHHFQVDFSNICQQAIESKRMCWCFLFFFIHLLFINIFCRVETFIVSNGQPSFRRHELDIKEKGMLTKPRITKLGVIYLQQTCHLTNQFLVLMFFHWEHVTYQHFLRPKSDMITFGFSWI